MKFLLDLFSDFWLLYFIFLIFKKTGAEDSPRNEEPSGNDPSLPERSGRENH